MRISISLLWLVGAIAAGCGSSGGNDGNTDASSDTGTTTSSTTAPTTSTTASTTAPTTSSTTDATESSGTTDVSTTASTGPEDSSSGAGSESGDSSGSSSSSDGGHGMCSQQQESCLEVQCCGNLDCCEGVPIPKGEAVCYSQCPDSDRNIKRGFVPVDVDDVLDRVTALPITTWSYIEDPTVRHIGPMAQDFQAAFAVGGSDKAIAKVDADGVALAAIQALDKQVTTLEAENGELRTTVEALQRRLDRLERGGR